MTGHLSERTRWAIVMAFAIATAWVEAAVCLHPRAHPQRADLHDEPPAQYERRSRTSESPERPRCDILSFHFFQDRPPPREEEWLEAPWRKGEGP